MTGNKYTTVENLAALYAVGWGAFVINPETDMFVRNPHLYNPMLSLVQAEAFWGAVAVVCGVIALICSYRECRRISAAIMSVEFVAFAVLFFNGDMASPAWYLYGLIGVWNFFHWYFLHPKRVEKANQAELQKQQLSREGGLDTWKLTKASSG